MNTDNLIVYTNISQVLTLEGVAKKEGRHTEEKDLGIIENATVVVDTSTGEILWIGSSQTLPSEYQNAANTKPSEGMVWIPELVECHTHLVYAGNRHHDYALRSQGKTYQQIASQGGGILSTLNETRKASLDELVQKAEQELDYFQSYGVGVVEIKSGYGLTLDQELKILECIEKLTSKTSIHLVATFMPGHMTPPEFKGKTDEYIDVVCREWIPEVAKKKLAAFFDVFVEQGYFSVDQTRKLCDSARAHARIAELA